MWVAVTPRGGAPPQTGSLDSWEKLPRSCLLPLGAMLGPPKAQVGAHRWNLLGSGLGRHSAGPPGLLTSAGAQPPTGQWPPSCKTERPPYRQGKLLHCYRAIAAPGRRSWAPRSGRTAARDWTH